jgi:hypothetical protein
LNSLQANKEATKLIEKRFKKEAVKPRNKEKLAQAQGVGALND